MGRILFFLVALLAVFAAVVVFAPGVIPVSTYKPRIEEAATNALGRPVTIGDNVSFKIVPRTAFRVEDLEIANAEGFEGDYLARVGQADIGVRLFKLVFDRAVEVDQFVLTDPDMNLRRAADGMVNWNFARPDAAPQEGTAPSGGAMRDLQLGDVRIVRGKAQYTDAAAGKTYTADDINITMVLKSLSAPLEIDGAMNFQGEPTTVDIVLTSLEDILANEPGNLKMDMQIGDATAGGDLTIQTGEALSYSGPVRLNAPDLPAFAALMGTELADAPGFDKLSFSGNVDGGETSLRVSDATINFDEIDAQGVVNLNWAGARPKASGILSTDNLDLRPYLPPPAVAPEGFPAWSEAPLDFTSLRNVDADFDISADAIFFNNLKIGESRLKLTIENGRLVADIPELAMYGGQGSGRLVVNARGGTPSLSGAVDMSSVNAQPLSLDLVKRDNLLGLGSMKLDFTASGASQAAIMRSLDGSGGFDLADGAVKGVNILKIARAVSEFKQGFNPIALQNAVATARGPAEQTDFSQFLSEFTISNGLMNTPTISLTGPFLTMSGAGTINLPNQTLDLRLSPRATTTSDGEGGQAVTIPLLIGGTFSKPAISVDAQQLILGGDGGGFLGDVIDKIGGGRQSDETSGENGEGQPAEEQDPAKAIFDSIFGPSGDSEDTGSGDSNAEDASAEETASPEETLLNDALSIFSGAASGDQSAEETKEQDPNQ